MLTLQDDKGIFWALESHVATLMPAPPERRRVVLADGSLGYCAGPLPQGPWAVAAGPTHYL